METMYGKIRQWEVKIDYVCTMLSVHKSFTISIENITKNKFGFESGFERVDLIENITKSMFGFESEFEGVNLRWFEKKVWLFGLR